MTLKDLARQAKEKAGNFMLDDFCQHVLNSVRKSESYAPFAALDYKKIYADYAASINKPTLTVDEKRQAILEHILNEGEGE